MHSIDKKQSRPYKICIANGFDQLTTYVCEVAKPSSLLIITDSLVAPLYLKAVVDALKQLTTVYTYSFEAGEQSKNLTTIQTIYDTMIKRQMDRNSLIVALGGGVVGDMAGFVAATYMRGIPFIQVPTTVLAQNDSSIGGKVGIDYGDHKNMVGAFYQPLLVYSNVNTLLSLPNREYYAGASEVIKHALIKSESLFKVLRDHKDQFHQKDQNFLEEMTLMSAQIKCDVVEEDVTEKNARKLLNFGHTIGHAIESLSNFSILHGECVAYGMCMSAFISYQRGFLSKEELNEIIALCKDYGLLTSLKNFEVQEIIDQMQYDKKKAYGKISFILLEGIGKSCIVTDVTDQEIKDAVIFTQKTCQ